MGENIQNSNLPQEISQKLITKIIIKKSLGLFNLSTFSRLVVPAVKIISKTLLQIHKDI